MLRNRWIGAALAISLALFGGCSSDDEGGGATAACNENPWSCGSGTTCWADAQAAFACLPAGTKQKGEQCVNAAGQADCGEGLFCFQNAAAPGTPAACATYCDAQHPCAGGETCAQVTTPAGLVMLCISQTTGAGGSGGGAGAAGAAGQAGSAPDAG